MFRQCKRTDQEMGHLFSKPINSWVLHYLRSLTEDGNGYFAVDEFQTEFSLNTFLGRDNAPKCHMLITNSSIQCQDLHFDGHSPIRMKSSKITFTIGRLVVRCDDLGYILRINKGRITIFDVHITASFNLTFVNGIRVSDIGAEATVNKIKTEIKLDINGTDRSRMANVLLSIDNPHVASNLLNAVFMILKENIKDFFNENIRDIASHYGL